MARTHILDTVGGDLPPGDNDELYAAGAAGIFGPGTIIADAAIDLINKLAAQLGHEIGSGATE
ncbi:hypothetical protein [Nocardia tengchongensis]|uniref:hypothetical protein n=1 Tax=Nocardia tengchongensis TaxID=2055889 RepID=UPI0036BE7EAF